ncbi:XRE family transcriptional regulator [Cupriavidus pinatubonensis]|uniref:XRE family transcriptional regulator n=1 Tax=Cupriavidus pinatubonensis TaxID=248026 RepID=UPI00112D455F|nr:XRE family transcriptional regulator [Cupriavidus pinatubonensis]TPQ44078.1 XRE family transcriptional regulator [Cupriavidus pinatubonensis]
MFRFEYGPSNVYVQLGFEDAEEIPLKAGIVKDITDRIRCAGLTLSDAATMLGTSQSDLLLALGGKLQSFRAAELLAWLDRLSFPLQLKNR